MIKIKKRLVGSVINKFGKKRLIYKSSPKSRASIVVKKGEGRWL